MSRASHHDPRLVLALGALALAAHGCDPGVFRESSAPAPRTHVDTPRDAGTAPDAGSRSSHAGAHAAAGASGRTAGAGQAAGASGASAASSDPDQDAGADSPCKGREVSLGTRVALEDRGVLPLPLDWRERLPGQTAYLGGHTAWLFPRTVRGPGSPPAPEGAPANYPTASVLLDRNLVPPRLAEVSAGYPSLISLAAGDPPETELWPAGLVRVGPDVKSGLVFFQRVLAGTQTDVLLAPLADNANVVGEPRPLFGPSDPKLATSPVLTNDFIYLFACTENTAVAADAPERHACALGRTPTPNAAQTAYDRASYQVFAKDGSWQAELTRAVPVLYGSSAPWVGFAGTGYAGFMAIHARAGTNRIAVQTAPRLSGPWTERGQFAAPGVPEGKTLLGVVRYGDEEIDPQTCSYRRLIAYAFATSVDAQGQVLAAETRLSALTIQ